MPIRNYLQLSIDHLGRDDEAALAKPTVRRTAVFNITAMQHGYLIRVPSSKTELKYVLQKAQEVGFGEPFVRVLEYAFYHRCGFVELSEQAPFDPELGVWSAGARR